MDKETKRQQLKESGRYPWKFAIAHLRYSTEPHLSERQASALLNAISGTYHQRREMACHLADLRIDMIVSRMAMRVIREMIRSQVPPEEQWRISDLT